MILVLELLLAVLTLALSQRKGNNKPGSLLLMRKVGNAGNSYLRSATPQINR
jgi:hypothetical protein